MSLLPLQSRGAFKFITCLTRRHAVPEKRASIGLVLGALTIGTLFLVVSHFSGTDNHAGVTVHLAGDSTMAGQLASKRPYTGWGEPFATMLCNGARVINHAQNGRSSKSFLSEGLWEALVSKLKNSDVVLIQFGHNDQKSGNESLYEAARDGYKKNLRGFIEDVRAKGAVPVLVTPLVRRTFDSQGELQATLGEYPAVVRKVADAMNVKLIDLNTITRDLLVGMGPLTSRDWFVHLAPGVSKNYPQGKQDDTHLSPLGAREIAGRVAIELRKTMPAVICPDT